VFDYVAGCVFDAFKSIFSSLVDGLRIVGPAFSRDENVLGLRSVAGLRRTQPNRRHSHQI